MDRVLSNSVVRDRLDQQPTGKARNPLHRDLAVAGLPGRSPEHLCPETRQRSRLPSVDGDRMQTNAHDQKNRHRSPQLLRARSGRPECNANVRLCRCHERGLPGSASHGSRGSPCPGRGGRIAPAPKLRSWDDLFVDNDGRLAAATALIRLADSLDYRDRADAGRALASFADVPETRVALLRLVLDADDTFVTHATTGALLGRRDATGLAIVATALATADFQHVNWIYTAVVDVFGIFATHRDSAVNICQILTGVEELTTREGADTLLDMLNEITPVLVPSRDH